jgi:hypothetical protein
MIRAWTNDGKAARPKIWGVFNFVTKHEDATRADLVRLGTSWDRVGQPGGMSYEDLFAWLAHAVNDHTTAVYRAHRGHDWDARLMVAVRTLEALEAANWQRAKRPSAPRPKPIPRPEALKPKDGDGGGEKKMGKPAPLSEIQKFLERKMAGKKPTGTDLAVGYISLTTDGSKIAEEVEKEIGVAAEKGGKAGAKKGNEALGKGLAAGAASMGAATGTQLAVGMHAAMAQNDLSGTIQAQIGTTPQYAKEIADAAGKAYATGWGGSLEEVGNIAAQTGQALNTLGDDSSIEDITTKTTAMAETFGQDAGAIVNSAKQMVQTGLAGNMGEALDQLAAGWQTNAKLGEDLTDTMDEYSTHFRQLGLTGADTIGLMNQGLMAGARNGDQVADSLKEYTLLTQGMSKSTSQAYKDIGLDAEKMQQSVSKGGPEAKAALTETLDALRKIKDPAAQSASAVGIFGTKSEDMQALLELHPNVRPKP